MKAIFLFWAAAAATFVVGVPAAWIFGEQILFDVVFPGMFVCIAGLLVSMGIMMARDFGVFK